MRRGASDLTAGLEFSGFKPSGGPDGTYRPGVAIPVASIAAVIAVARVSM